jgi:uncharacterized protein YdeI (YjbR/CyaY-like superfamily)
LNNTSVDSFLQLGCGRCALFATPECKVHRWTEELRELREILRESGLKEEMKWGAPCYTRDGRNVVMIAALKECCVLSFLQGAALSDPDGWLESPGPNSRFGRYLKFRSLTDVIERREAAQLLIQRAIAWADSGATFVPDAEPDPLPDALQQLLDEDPALRLDFDTLTPGRQRSHAIYVGGAKGFEARQRRAERCAEKIRAGLGFHDR